MKQTERHPDLEEALRAAMDGRLAEVWTAAPGIVDAYNADGTCSVRIAIKAKIRDRTGAERDEEIKVLGHCPVVFPQGGGFALTFPMARGDEGLLVFASRCIDAWWEQGGVSVQAELRMHSVSDGFFIPGVRSKPRALGGVSLDAVQLRNEDGSVFVEVGSAGVKIKGNLEIEGTVTANGVPIDETHTHSGVTAGGGSSGPPNP